MDHLFAYFNHLFIENEDGLVQTMNWMILV